MSASSSCASCSRSLFRSGVPLRRDPREDSAHLRGYELPRGAVRTILRQPKERVERAVGWVKDDPFGVELAEVAVSGDALSAAVVAIGTDPAPYRLDYSLETGPGFVTSRLHVTARGERLRQELDLRRSAAGDWSADTELPDLAGALDCDLGLSPLTNSMPVLRHDLLRTETAEDFLMAWVSVPDLAVHAAPQRYTGLGNGRVRFESLDGTFTAEISFDQDGLVLDYPGIAKRLRLPSGG